MTKVIFIFFACLFLLPFGLKAQENYIDRYPTGSIRSEVSTSETGRVKNYYSERGFLLSEKCFNNMDDSTEVKYFYNGEFLDSTCHFYNGKIQRIRTYQQTKAKRHFSDYDISYDFKERIGNHIYEQLNTEIVYFFRTIKSSRELNSFKILYTYQLEQYANPKKGYFSNLVSTTVLGDKSKINGSYSSYYLGYNTTVTYLNGILDGLYKRKEVDFYWNNDEKLFVSDSGMYKNGIKTGIWSDQYYFTLDSKEYPIGSKQYYNSVAEIFGEEYTCNPYNNGYSKIENNYLNGLRTGWNDLYKKNNNWDNLPSWWQVSFDKGNCGFGAFTRYETKNPYGVEKEYETSLELWDEKQNYNITDYWKKNLYHNVNYKNYKIDSGWYYTFDRWEGTFNKPINVIQKLPGDSLHYKKTMYSDEARTKLQSVETLLYGMRDGQCIYYNRDGSINYKAVYDKDSLVEITKYKSEKNSTNKNNQQVVLHFDANNLYDFFNKTIYQAVIDPKKGSEVRIDIDNITPISLNLGEQIDKNGNIIGIEKRDYNDYSNIITISKYNVSSNKNEKLDVLFPVSIRFNDWKMDKNGAFILVGNSFADWNIAEERYQTTNSFIAKIDENYKLVYFEKTPYHEFDNLFISADGSIYIAGVKLDANIVLGSKVDNVHFESRWDFNNQRQYHKYFHNYEKHIIPRKVDSTSNMTDFFDHEKYFDLEYYLNNEEAFEEDSNNLSFYDEDYDFYYNQNMLFQYVLNHPKYPYYNEIATNSADTIYNKTYFCLKLDADFKTIWKKIFPNDIFMNYDNGFKFKENHKDLFIQIATIGESTIRTYMSRLDKRDGNLNFINPFESNSETFNYTFGSFEVDSLSNMYCYMGLDLICKTYFDSITKKLELSPFKFLDKTIKIDSEIYSSHSLKCDVFAKINNKGKLTEYKLNYPYTTYNENKGWSCNMVKEYDIDPEFGFVKDSLFLSFNNFVGAEETFNLYSTNASKIKNTSQGLLKQKEYYKKDECYQPIKPEYRSRLIKDEKGIPKYIIVSSMLYEYEGYNERYYFDNQNYYLLKLKVTGL